MMDLEQHYLKLPVSLQNIACSAKGWWIQRSRYGPDFNERLQRARERLTWSNDRIIEYRDARLSAFVEHCARTVPFYRNLFREYGIEPQSIRRLDDLAVVPVLSKATVQQCYPQLLSEAVPARQRIIAHTSGTTGGGLRFASTWDSIHEQQSVWLRYWELHGLKRGNWCGYFGGRSVVSLQQQKPPFWRYNYAGRQILFSGYHLSAATFGDYVEELRRRQPPWLHGYPSMLALLGSFVLDSNCRLGYTPQWITTGAENLLRHQIKIIEEAFGRRPIQHYGMAEAVANCCECRKGKLHVDEDFAAAEFIPIQNGSACKVVGTAFTNFATSLLRYDTGDVVELDHEPCDCGLPGRIIKTVDGRQEDYVILRNGARIGRMDHIFKDMISIREAQIYQETPGVIVVRIVPNTTYDGTEEARLGQEIHKRVGDLADVIVERVDHIQRSNFGKLRFVVSRIEEGRFASSAPRV